MENTQENNILIAEFMGMQQTGLGWFDNEEFLPEIVRLITGSNTFDDLLFHTSWDWLMPVVDKLENSGVEITIGRMFCEIKYQDLFNKEKKFDIRIVSGVKINAVNGAIVELIKWYNLNK